MAFQSKSGWAVIVIDDGPAATPPAPITLRIPTGGHALAPVAAVRTSDSLDLAPVPLPRYRDGTITTSVASRSVTTFVLTPSPSRGQAATAALTRPGQGSRTSIGRAHVVQNRRATRA